MQVEPEQVFGVDLHHLGEALEASNGSGKELSCVQHIARRPSAFSRPTSYTSREMRAHVDFPDGESATLSWSAWWVKHEGRMDGDPRECEIAACASVGAEIQTCIQDMVRSSLLNAVAAPREGYGRGKLFLPRSLGGHPVSQWAKSKMHPQLHPSEEMQGP